MGSERGADQRLPDRSATGCQRVRVEFVLPFVERVAEHLREQRGRPKGGGHQTQALARILLHLLEPLLPGAILAQRNLLPNVPSADHVDLLGEPADVGLHGDTELGPLFV